MSGVPAASSVVPFRGAVALRQARGKEGSRSAEREGRRGERARLGVVRDAVQCSPVAASALLVPRPVAMPAAVGVVARLPPARRPRSSSQASAASLPPVGRAKPSAPAPALAHEWLAAATTCSSPTIVRHFPGRDLGVAVIRTVGRGEPLLVEKPLIRLTPNIGGPRERWYGEPDVVRKALGTLSRAGPQKTLTTFFDKHLDPVISTNSFTLSCALGGIHSYVFRKISRINHSCDPNAALFWDADAETATVRATRAIAAGAEVTINYGAMGNRDERRRHLRLCFGFDCACPRCSADAAVRDVADRTLQLQLLDQVEGRSVSMPARREP